MNLKLEDFELVGDGLGFFDHYTKKISWCGLAIDVDIVCRKVSENALLFINELVREPEFWNDYFKSYIKDSTGIEEIECSAITIGYDQDADFCVWFYRLESAEHGIQVYGNFNKELIRIGEE